jgi:hypothetical protein
MSDDTHDHYEPSIWQRVKLEQTIDGQLEIMYLSPDQAALLIDYLHQAALTQKQHRR